jgi:cell cycle arrest protein BUB2
MVVGKEVELVAQVDSETLRTKYYELIEYGNTHPQECSQNLSKLRQLILLHGLPPESEHEMVNRLEGNTVCSLRGMIWKIMLNVKAIDAEKYISLVQKGKPRNDIYQQIRKDIPRTFMNDNDFANSVSQDKLARCLSAFARYSSETPGKGTKIGYVQGMNALCGPFLYVLPEVEAFYAFCTFIMDSFCLYVVPNIEGVHSGLKLLDRIMLHVDPELYKHLHTHSYHPELLTHAVLSLGTGTPPLEEVLHLWDFYFAFGIHMNIVCTVAQLVLMRDVLLSSHAPCAKLRTLPSLHAQSIITLAVQLVRQLPNDLYDMLALHPTTPVQIPKCLRLLDYEGNEGVPGNSPHISQDPCLSQAQVRSQAIQRKILISSPPFQDLSPLIQR